MFVMGLYLSIEMRKYFIDFARKSYSVHTCVVLHTTDVNGYDVIFELLPLFYGNNVTCDEGASDVRKIMLYHRVRCSSTLNQKVYSFSSLKIYK